MVVFPKRSLKAVFIFIALLLTSCAFYITIGIISLRQGKPVLATLEKKAISSILPRLLQIGFPKGVDLTLQGEAQGRVNILLLGIGGKGHEGSALADTVIFVSLYPKEKKIALLSIPRDLVVPIPEFGWRKVNTLDAIGEFRQEGSGGEYSREELEAILDEKIPYYVRVDFKSFEQFIDTLGGVGIDVEHTLVDYHYPILGKEQAAFEADRYETLHIPKGRQFFDGALALKYVRSRYALPPENSDFARMKRQQKMLEAIKSKISSLGIRRISKLVSLAGVLQEHVTTNLTIGEIYKIWQILEDIPKDGILTASLEPGPPSGSAGEDALIRASSGIDGAFILEPVKDDFSEIRSFIDHLLFAGKESPLKNVKKGEGISVSVLNGTTITGLAAKRAGELKQDGFTISDVGNAPTRDFQKNVIYILRKDAPLETAKYLKEALNANIAPSIPDSLKKTISSKVDFVIILGERLGS